MTRNPLRRKKDLRFERSYPASPEAVWRAWTEADRLRQWWGPDKTRIDECEIDAQIGGRIYVVTEATEEMGKYAGTRWPTEGVFTVLESPQRLTYEAKSWTEGEDGTTIHHVNDVTLTGDGDRTVVNLHIAILEIGPKAKLAAFGMKWGYKAHLDALEKYLAG